MNVYAPTEGSDDVVMDRFYQTVEGVDNSRSNYDIKMVIRDLNVRLDKKIHTVELLENIAYVWKLTIMDREFINCAVFRSMIIASSFCPHKDIHKTTWTSQDDDTSNQIDHTLIGNRIEGNISDVRSDRGQIVAVIINW
jgi:hypothetical protein